jgi:hypothetical protein
MTTYTVHLYREMRLVFPDIEAATHNEAARLASLKPTNDAEHIEDCEGHAFSALVEREGGDGPEEHPIILRADGGEIEHSPEAVTNRTRAAWAEACVSVFVQHTGCDREDSLGDLLCDLMHWAERHDFDFDIALDRARGHFEAELLEDLPAVPAPPTLQAALSNLLGETDYDEAGTCISCGRERGGDEYQHCGGYLGEIAHDCPRAYARAAMSAAALAEPPAPPPEPLREALLDIKRLASKYDDPSYEPLAVLELIEMKAIAALTNAKGGAQ